MLFSSYRLDQYPAPEAFQTQVAMIFAEFPDEVLAYLTDPTNPNSLQRRHKWPPVIEEIGKACVDAVGTVRALKRMERLAEEGFTWVADRGGFYDAAGRRYVERESPEPKWDYSAHRLRFMLGMARGNDDER
jgi:hypothetical protein